MTAEGLSQAIGTVIRDCLGVAAGEEVLVICNPATQELGAMFRDSAQGAGGEAALIVIAERESHAAEPPATLAAAMLEANVIVAPTLQSISHTAARKAASDAGVRVASMPGVTAEMLARVMGADMEKLRARGEFVSRALSEGSEARITCPHGGDLRLGLEGRTAIPDAGVLSGRGAWSAVG